MSKMLYELKDMLCEELDKITDKGELTPGSLDIVDKLTHSIKSIDTIIAMDEAGYSSDGGRMYDDRGSYNYNSYARGRRGNVRRDAMGRYSRDDAMEEIMQHLRAMENAAKDDTTRSMVQKWIKQAEQD